jgi:hypothetical protein
MILRNAHIRALNGFRLLASCGLLTLLSTPSLVPECSTQGTQPYLSIVSQDSFVSTGAMQVDRFGQSAVLLPNGQVLIVGGYQWRVPPDAPIGRNTCEIYDPASAVFFSTGFLNIARTEPRAFLLPTGKVVVASREAQRLELYDPSARTFRFTNASVSPVYEATALADGRVLFYGETCESCVPLTVYIYDGSADRLITGTSIGAGRAYGTATLLSNGKVLVAGGYTHNFNNGNYVQTYLSSADILDLETGKAEPTGSMVGPRVYHTATLLPNGKVLIVGGAGGGPIMTSAELYDPVAGTFTRSSSSLTVRRHLHTATLLPNGKVLIAGGDTGDGNPTASAEIYDPVTDSFSLINNMVQARAQHTATLLLDGRVLMAGGYTRIGSQTPGISGAELFVADVVPCSFRISPASQSFDTSGGVGSVSVSAPPGCSWAAKSNDSWIDISFGVVGSGEGTVRYSVAANAGMSSRTSSITIADQMLTITQAALDIKRPNIANAAIAAKNLIVTGDNFDAGALILLNGEQQKTLHDEQDPRSLVGKKVGKKIAPGQTVLLQVRNSDGILSPDFSFTRP